MKSQASRKKAGKIALPRFAKCSRRSLIAGRKVSRGVRVLCETGSGERHRYTRMKRRRTERGRGTFVESSWLSGVNCQPFSLARLISYVKWFPLLRRVSLVLPPPFTRTFIVCCTVSLGRERFARSIVEELIAPLFSQLPALVFVINDRVFTLHNFFFSIVIFAMFLFFPKIHWRTEIESFQLQRR